MNVHDCVAICLNHPWVKSLHVPGEHDKVYVMLQEHVQQLRNKLLLNHTLPGSEGERGNIMESCNFQNPCTGIVADDKNNSGARQFPFFHRLKNGLKIRASSRPEYSNVQHVASHPVCILQR